MSGSAKQLAHAARILNQGFINRIKSQLHRFWLPYESASPEEAVRIFSALGDLFTADAEVNNTLSGVSGPVKDNADKVPTYLADGMRHSHVLQSLRVGGGGGDPSQVQLQVRYTNENPRDGRRQILLNYDIKLALVDELLPRIASLTIKPGSGIEGVDDFKPAYELNRVTSFASYWASLIEEANSKDAVARITETLPGLLHSDLHWVSPDGAERRSAADMAAFFASVHERILFSAHWLAELEVLPDGPTPADVPEGAHLIHCRLVFDWSGVARGAGSAPGPVLEARTQHHWTLVDVRGEPWPKLARAKVEALIPFRPME